MHMITRASIAVNGDVHLLSVGADVPELKRLIVAAVRAGGGFVDMVAAGNRAVSVLVTGTTAVTFSSEDVVVDSDESWGAAAAIEEDSDQSHEGDWRSW